MQAKAAILATQLRIPTPPGPTECKAPPGSFSSAFGGFGSLRSKALEASTPQRLNQPHTPEPEPSDFGGPKVDGMVLQWIRRHLSLGVLRERLLPGCSAFFTLNLEGTVRPLCLLASVSGFVFAYLCVCVCVWWTFKVRASSRRPFQMGRFVTVLGPMLPALSQLSDA